MEKGLVPTDYAHTNGGGRRNILKGVQPKRLAGKGLWGVAGYMQGTTKHRGVGETAGVKKGSEPGKGGGGKEGGCKEASTQQCLTSGPQPKKEVTVKMDRHWGE